MKCPTFKIRVQNYYKNKSCILTGQRKFGCPDRREFLGFNLSRDLSKNSKDNLKVREPKFM